MDSQIVTQSFNSCPIYSSMFIIYDKGLTHNSKSKEADPLKLKKKTEKNR